MVRMSLLFAGLIIVWSLAFAAGDEVTFKMDLNVGDILSVLTVIGACGFAVLSVRARLGHIEDRLQEGKAALFIAEEDNKHARKDMETRISDFVGREMFGVRELMKAGNERLAEQIGGMSLRLATHDEADRMNFKVINDLIVEQGRRMTNIDAMLSRKQDK